MVSWLLGIVVSSFFGCTDFFIIGFSTFTGSSFWATGSAGGGVVASTLGCVGAKKGLSAKPDFFILLEPPLLVPYRHELRRNSGRAQIYGYAWNVPPQD